MDIEKIDARRIGTEILVIPMFITGILVIFTDLSILIISGISFLLGIIIVLADFLSKLEKPPTPETPTAETPAQKTETKSYAGTAIKVVATIAIAIIIFCAGFAGYNHFFSDDSSGKNSQKTANAENIVTVRVYANGYTCAVTPFFEKGQTIVITASEKDKLTASTNTKNPLYRYVGPTGWQTDPKLPGRKLDLDPSVPFLALLGYFTDESGKSATTVFYIGREKTIITERAGTEKICLIPNNLNEDNTPKDNGGYFTVTIRVI